MKKALVISMLAGSFLFGQQVVIYPDRMKNMQEMETAMSEIQKGFLYDNVNVVKNGVKHLKVTIAHTESFIKEGVGENKINNKVLKGTGRLFPSIHNTQGFFVSRLKKK